MSLSTALCWWRNALNCFPLSRAVSAAFFLPRLGITTVGTGKLNSSQSAAR
jgi:hypothetical protein